MASPCTDLTEGTYIVRYAANTGYALDIAGGVYANGTNVQLYANSNGRAQQWHIVRQSSNIYQLKCADSTGYGLDLTGGVVENGRNVQIYALGSNPQLWRIDKNNNGTVTFIPYNSSNQRAHLNLDGGTAANQTNIHIWVQDEKYKEDGYGSTITAERWTLVRVYFTVVFNKNGGSGSMSNQKIWSDLSTALTANAFTRIGHTFKNWNTKADGSGTSYANKKSVKTLTKTHGGTVNLYAQWAINTYKVAYDGNGATSGSMSASSHTYGTAKNLTANAYARTGYTFKNWNTKKDGSGTSYANSASVKNLTTTNGATVTLYAQWTAISYTVAFNANGGTGSMGNQSRVYGDGKALTANAFTRIGHTFKNWNTASGGTGTAFADKVTSNIRTTAGTTTLYAQWTSLHTNPALTGLKVNRCDADGMPNDEGTCALVEFSWSVYNVNGYYDQGSAQTAALSGTITPQGGTATAFTIAQPGTGVFSGSASAIVTGLSVDIQYSVNVTVADATSSTAKSLTLTRAAWIIDVGNEGASMGLGVSAPQADGLEIGFETTFDRATTLRQSGANPYHRLRADDGVVLSTSETNGVTRNIYNGMTSQDANGQWYAVWESLMNASGTIQNRIRTHNKTTAGTDIYNDLILQIGKDGVRTVQISEALAWRKALGASSSGIWPVSLGGTGSNGYGAMATKDQSSNVSMATSTWTDVASISMAAGTWLMIGGVYFASNATGRRYIELSPTSGTSSTARLRQSGLSQAAVNGAVTIMRTSAIVELTATTTYYVMGWQNSGAALNVTGFIRAFRLE